MKKILQGITKEEWLIGGAVALLFYVVFSRRKPTKSDKKSSSRMIIDDLEENRKAIPPDVEAQFKKVVGANYDQFIADISSFGLDKEIAIRQLWTETSFDPKVINCSISSSAGAKGLAQMMPITWQGYGGGGNICNVEDSLKAYKKLMRDLMKRYPNRIDLVLAGYNWSPYNNLLKNALENNIPFSKYKSSLPRETRKYIATILQP